MHLLQVRCSVWTVNLHAKSIKSVSSQSPHDCGRCFEGSQTVGLVGSRNNDSVLDMKGPPLDLGNPQQEFLAISSWHIGLSGRSCGVGPCWMRCSPGFQQISTSKGHS